MKNVTLPRYTIGPDALNDLERVVSAYGRKVALIHGAKAYAACQALLTPALVSLDVVREVCYGQEATYENVARLTEDPDVRRADVLVGIGGGKCLDTVKLAGDQLGKPVVTIATIASTCAAVTKISIMYNADGSFKDIPKLKAAPVHCLIPTSVIAEAPIQYLWAGIGDTMAKHVECTFSARNDQLDYASELGRTISAMCFEPVIAHGASALRAAKNQEVSDDLEQIIQNILISTGSVSLLVHPDYNSALAHALFYGLTVREHIEKNHLHGEVVSYGTLVQLMMDGQMEMLQKAYAFHRQIGLPVCLADLELSKDDPLSDVLEMAEKNQELHHVPYPVTQALIRKAIDDLENYAG